ncbi:amidophosphoribosyltransferase [Effusibacillus lacus]|uniref:Amidophosphoribosyltransferase n=1 Tax=Effusibacillus lacus TaxID=1348429 RepID=A0A292YIN6_9BACL|nr:amidophosphoribosyltransferase [Effusibacillus lacus]TCS74289.1 amidophosphoribosyltransferase [Effusibacillus lacus]GAX88749.1 amidophosphoribosyltransferase [Effusibacillus lacus]
MHHEMMSDKWHEECGVFGIYGHPNAAELTYYGLYALQHRGQESAGIASVDGRKMYQHKGMGLVSEVFDSDVLKTLKGHAAIGHVRYSTTGETSIANAQPLTFGSQRGNMALAHNGNLINAFQLHNRLERQGSIFQTTSDTEVVAHLIARSGLPTIEENVKESLSIVKGAFAFLILTDDKLLAMRDPHGLRPMALGQFEGAYVVASETCAFDTIGAEYLRDIEPGEMLVIDKNGLHSSKFAHSSKTSLCTFEYIYFARPDSDIDGFNVHSVRKKFGKLLAEEHPVDADVVIGVPDSSISAAIGYAEATGIPYEIGLIKNRYIGRTFIQPSQELRERGVKLKLSAVRSMVDGKRVVLIDDSIVRGTTSKRIVQMLRDAGATEVHLLISSPPVTNACYYGIDTSARNELIAANKTVEEIRDYIGADSLHYLSEEKMLSAFDVVDFANHKFCNACFTGRYPTEVYEDLEKHMLER